MSILDEFTPATESELCRFLAENASGPRRAVYPVGGRTALNVGRAPAAPGILASTANLNAVIDYPARDMTVTVQAGLRAEALAALLAEQQQQLPIDIPQAHRATLGGAVACNTSGPRRFGYGTLRDYVIGIAAVDAHGRLFHAGGRVVKNVAGYDLCKLLVGSLGTLAVITQLTFKLRPLPESRGLLWCSVDGFEDIDIVLERLVTSQTRPVGLEVLNRPAARQVAADARLELPASAPVLCVLFEGSSRETDWQIERARQEIAPLGPSEMTALSTADAGKLLAALTEFCTHSDAPLTFQANLLPSRTLEFLEQADQRGAALQAHAGNGIVLGQLPDDVLTAGQAAEFLAPLRQQARAARGNLVVVDCDGAWKEALPVFGEPEPAWPLMQKLKQTLDPYGIFSPGRLC